MTTKTDARELAAELMKLNCREIKLQRIREILDGRLHDIRSRMCDVTEQLNETDPRVHVFDDWAVVVGYDSEYDRNTVEILPV
jgi:predicted MarR family transcription regulator